MISSDLSYAFGAMASAANIGTFFAGRRAGRHQALADTNEAQALTIEAQSKRIDVLVAEKADLQREVDHLVEIQKQMQTQLDLLKELVVRGPVVVQPGTLPDVPR